ncbi:MAG: SRPBCC domain-containing protein [Planctomycetota bacterium]|nr:SRPBCC domain-containing protein [Planctomycetota bacterium]
MTIAASRTLEPGAATVKVQVTIDASAERVWETLTREPDAWWIQDLRCVAAPSRLSLDLRAGGALAETNDAGASLLWFHVIAIEPGRSLNLAGSLAPPYWGPAGTFLLIELSEEDGATSVGFTTSLFGHVGAGLADEIGSGWQQLLDRGLKPYIETGAVEAGASLDS